MQFYPKCATEHIYQKSLTNLISNLVTSEIAGIGQTANFFNGRQAQTNNVTQKNENGNQWLWHRSG
jgi:hypothetical protein